MANHYLSYTAAQLDEAIGKVLSGELDVPLQEKTVIPSEERQVVIPDSGYKGLSKVTVEAIPKIEKPYLIELEYIQSSGTQYIDTGFKPNQDTRVVMDFELLAVVGQYADPIFGVRTSASSKAYYLWVSGYSVTTEQYQSGYNNGSTYPQVTRVGRHKVDKNKNVTTVDGVSVSATYTSFTTDWNMLLFNSYNNGSLYASTTTMRLYSCQIYDNGTLIRDYIPVLDKQCTPCLYDKVNGVFYYNAGTGQFSCPEKPYLTRVAYIQSTGTQRIDTGVPFNVNNTYVIEAECCFTGSGASYIGWDAGGQFGMNANGNWHHGSSASTMTVSAKTMSKVRLTINSGTSTNSVLEVIQNETTNSISRVHSSMGSYATVNYPIFALSNTSGGYASYANMQLKTFSITVNGVLVRDYMSVLDTTLTPCLYDKVNKTLNYNAGSGTFSYTV